MAAVVKIYRLTGTQATPTTTDVTSGSVHAGTQDANTSPCKIPVPSSGSNHSFWVNTQLSASVAPDNSITNVKWYSDGGNSFGTGICNSSAMSCKSSPNEFKPACPANMT